MAHGSYCGDSLLLLHDFSTLNPTIFTSVPLKLNNVQGMILENAKAAGGMKQWMFKYAVDIKTQNLLLHGSFT
jgi:long-chain acyl-CoA synthetase